MLPRLHQLHHRWQLWCQIIQWKREHDRKVGNSPRQKVQQELVQERQQAAESLRKRLNENFEELLDDPLKKLKGRVCHSLEDFVETMQKLLEISLK